MAAACLQHRVVIPENGDVFPGRVKAKLGGFTASFAGELAA